MKGMHELLFFLFSSSEMMLTVLIKPYIVDIIEKQGTDTVWTTANNPASAGPILLGNKTVRTDLPSLSKDTNTDKLAQRNNRTQEKRATRGGERSEKQGSGDQPGGESLEKRAAVYLMIDLAGTYLPWLILGPFCGVWSDRHSRKLPLLLPPLCHVLSVVAYMLVHYRPDMLLAAVTVGSLCRGMTGKHAMFATVILSLTSDVTQEGQRSQRFAFLIAARYVGISFGSLCGGLLEEIVGVHYSIVTSSALQALLVVLVIIFVKETIDERSPLPGKKHASIATTFKAAVKNVSECVCCVKNSQPRDEEERANGSALICSDAKQEKDYQALSSSGSGSTDNSDKMRLLVVMINAISVFTQTLWSSQRELIVQSVTVPPLNWPTSWYGYLSAAYFGMTGLSLLMLVPCLVRVMPLGCDPDCAVLIISLVCGAVCGVWTGRAIDNVSSWQIFCAYVVGAFGPASNAPLRTMLSQCVGASSQGKMFAVQFGLENLSKVLGPLAHTAIYVSSLSLHPSLVYYVMAGEAILILPVVVWMCRMFREATGR